MGSRHEPHASWLRRWTGAPGAAVLYDSDADEFTGRGFVEAVRTRANVAVVAFTADGDVCGLFYRVAVTEENTAFFDPSVFAFSFESHGRCASPQRFVVKRAKKKKAHVVLSTTYPEGFVSLHVGASSVSVGTDRARSLCRSLSSAFEAMEDTTLTGRRGPRAWHRWCRVIALHLV